jgi:hypothetical protein
MAGIITEFAARAPDPDNGRLNRRSAPALPDGAAYQQSVDVFGHERRPLRALGLCLALDLPGCPNTSKTRLSPSQKFQAA